MKSVSEAYAAFRAEIEPQMEARRIASYDFESTAMRGRVGKTPLSAYEINERKRNWKRNRKVKG